MSRPVLAALLAAGAAALTPAAALAAPVPRTEVPIASHSALSDVASSWVSLRVPPATSTPHTEACNWISYERFRSVDGPTDPTQADAVAILQPGILEGATAFDPVARSAVREARRRGKNLEVWAIDRRANCLEDHTGIDRSEQTQDPEDALGYYYRGRVIDGKTFNPHPDTRILADLGIAQTVKDEYAILTNELPGQAWREQHVICGGHSLGGPITEAFAGWDFDGNPATTTDAGYRQCAGFFGFETVLNGGFTTRGSTSGTAGIMTALGGGLAASIKNVTVPALKAGLIPRYVDLFGISPEIMNLLEFVGGAADLQPTRDTLPYIGTLPRTQGVETFLKLAGSPDLASWLGGKTSLRDYHYTAMALLGQILDDNAGVYGLVRSSFGYFDAPALRRNRLPDEISIVPGLNQLVMKGRIMLPQKLAGNPLIGWKNYDELGSGASQIGAGVTTPGDEVTDAREYARAIHEGPGNLTENWFPLRLFVDLSTLGGGDRSGDLKNAIWGHPTTLKPRAIILGGDGLKGVGGTKYDPNPVVAPGYQHLDVVTATEHQNDGKPELSSQTFVNLALGATAGG